MSYKKNITPVDFLEQEDEPEESFYSNEDMKKYFDEKYKGWEKDFGILKNIYEQEEFRKSWEDRINPF